MSEDFKWTDELVKEMIYKKLPVPDHYIANVQKCLDEFKKSKQRSPLFTTQDGKEIFEGDEWWMVREEGAHTSEWEVVHMTCNYAINDGKKPKRCKAAFSTEERANEFVINNRPCLSVKDICGLWVIDNHARKRLEELAKQKINV